MAASDKYLYSDRSSLILNQEMNGNYLRFKLFLKCLYESRLAAEPQNCALVVSFL